MEILLDLGTHQIKLYPEGESLRAEFTWHKPIVIHDWSLRRLAEWAAAAENDHDYPAAERQFIKQAIGE